MIHSLKLFEMAKFVFVSHFDSHWALCDDGWVRQGGKEGTLLFYVPLIHRTGFRQATIARMIGDHAAVDVSSFIHGDEWEKGWIGVTSD